MQDTFQPISCLISCAGETGRWGLLSHAQNTCQVADLIHIYDIAKLTLIYATIFKGQPCYLRNVSRQSISIIDHSSLAMNDHALNHTKNCFDISMIMVMRAINLPLGHFRSKASSITNHTSQLPCKLNNLHTLGYSIL